MRLRTKEVLGHLAANVRRARLRRGLTQAELAEAAEQDLSYLQRIERGATNMTVAVLVALADALQTTPGSLFKTATPVDRGTGRPKTQRRSSPRR